MSQNLSQVVVPRHVFEELEKQAIDTEGLVPAYIKRPRDEIRPERLNYPWKDHPIKREKPADE